MLVVQPIALRRSQWGVTMLEVLVTLVILAFGLLGLAGLNARIQTSELEAYQRARAILLLRDMVERVKANSADAASYVPPSDATNKIYGTDYTVPTDCATSQAVRDICEWSNALTGAAESSSGTRVGAMIGARGCIEQIQAPNTDDGVCTPGIYRATVVWQGLTATGASQLKCGAGKYGTDDAMRRAISSDIVVGLPLCV